MVFRNVRTDENNTKEHDDLVFWVLQNFEKVLKYPLENKYILECPLLRGFHRNILGYADILVYKNTYSDSSIGNPYPVMLIEVKPQILSIGDTIRQIQMYRECFWSPNEQIRKNIWQESDKKLNDVFCAIVTKTKGLKEIFASQNIQVYEVE
jgi:hypothetical protein